MKKLLTLSALSILAASASAFADTCKASAIYYAELDESVHVVYGPSVWDR